MTATYTRADLGSIVPPRDSGPLSRLKTFLAGHQGNTRLTADDGASMEVPAEVYAVITQAVDALADGSAVAVAPLSAKLTTTQAAEVLGVSRPTLIKMLEAGEIPFEQLNVHRTLRLADVLAFKERRHIERRALLAELTRQAIEDGLYEASYADYAQALDDARHHRL